MKNLKYLLPMLLCFLFMSCHDEDEMLAFFVGRTLINDEQVLIKMIPSSEEKEYPCVVVDWKTSDNSSIYPEIMPELDRKIYGFLGADYERKLKRDELLCDSIISFTYYSDESVEPISLVIDRYNWSDLDDFFVTIDFTNKTFSFGKSTE